MNAVSAPTSPPPVLTHGNTTPMWKSVRRLLLLDRAREALGGAARLAEAIGIGRRAINHKLAADRRVSNAELRAVAVALDARASSIAALAVSIREMIDG